MPYQKRIQNITYIENEKLIESDWDKLFGDRKNEIVFIGQNMNEEQIKQELDSCLSTDNELTNENWKKGFDDEWPVERVYALD